MRSSHPLIFLCYLITATLLLSQTALGADQGIQLNDISQLLERKTLLRHELEVELATATVGESVEIKRRLDTVQLELSRLNESFKYVALGDTDLDLSENLKIIETTWQQDLVEVVKPLIDSLKSVTAKPRKLSQLREQLLLLDQRSEALTIAIDKTNAVVKDNLDPAAKIKIISLSEVWNDEKQQLVQDRLILAAKLDDLTDSSQSVLASIVPAAKSFVLGRGLTLVLALVAGILSWALMRILWWTYTTKFTSKATRRHSVWYRVTAYSYYLITLIVITLAVLVVLYSREDLLLLAIAFLLIAGAALSFRNFLPKYVAEAKLLLNVGGVREEERVMYNGLPWQIESINLYSVLRNPALDGVIRLPLSTLEQLISRPVKNKLWFPTVKGDFVILPDGVVAQVKNQTPDLVELSARAGMVITYTSADFFSLNIYNLSTDKTFGVSITFGLDYGLQALCLTDIPEAIKQSVMTTLDTAGYTSTRENLLVELANANNSSLDFLVHITMKSKVAGDYLKIQRLLMHACIDVCNRNKWNIPYPQLTVHQPILPPSFLNPPNLATIS